MSFTLALMGLSLHVLLWEKLPDWGNWFNWIVERLPKPLAYLYQAWRCPYCFGFWIALVLHALTGIFTINALAQLPDTLGVFTTPLAWFLDALATALLIMVGSLLIKAIAGPAINGYKMTQEFKASMQNLEQS